MKITSLLLIILAGICLILFGYIVGLPDIILNVAGLGLIIWGLWEIADKRPR